MEFVVLFWKNRNIKFYESKRIKYNSIRITDYILHLKIEILNNLMHRVG